MASGKPHVSEQERQELRSLVEACTPGPWRVLRDQATRGAVRGRTADAQDDFDIDPVCQILTETVWGNHDDLFLMAAAREAIPKLLDEIERLEAAEGGGSRAAGKKAAATRKRRAAGAKAAVTRRRRSAGKKAAITKTRRAAGRKAATTRKRRAAAKKAAATRKSGGKKTPKA